jgi:membrane-bound serine protease (ClpP class)
VTRADRRWLFGFAVATVVLVGGGQGWGQDRGPGRDQEQGRDQDPGQGQGQDPGQGQGRDPGQGQDQDRADPDPDPDPDPAADPDNDAYHPAPSAHADAGPRDVRVDAPAGADVIVVPIEDTVELGLAAFVRRALDEHGDAALIVLEINTLGGRVDAAIQIRDALLASKVKTVALIAPRAISAGALIALACDVIAVTPGATIGAATPIQAGGGAEAEPVDEKMTSYMRTEMRATAEAKGRRGDIAEAMVDADVEIAGITPEGKLLTLDTDGALRHRIADVSVADLDELLARMELRDPKIVRLSETWAEEFVRFLTDPLVSGILMSLGMLALFLSFYTGHFGVPAVVGLVCLGLFFLGHLTVHLAGWEELTLFGIGVLLLLLEAFVFPGFGIAGIAGIAAVAVSLVLALSDMPLEVSFDTGELARAILRVGGSFAAAILLGAVAMRFVARTPAARRLVLQTAASRKEGFVSSAQSPILPGDQGTAITDLRPAGKANIGGLRVDVVSEQAYVDRGKNVRVIAVEGSRVVVREVEP